MASVAAFHAKGPWFPGLDPGALVSDEELVERTLRGEDDAFRCLYDRYRRRVFATVRRIIRDTEDARDAMQEVFVKVYRALSGWDPRRARFSTWLYRLAANHAIDNWRMQRRRTGIPWEEMQGGSCARLIAKASAGRDGLDPVMAFEREERLSEIRRHVNELPALQRKVFVLRHFHGWKLHEIAAAEGRKLATVKTSLYRATIVLRGKISCRQAGAGRQTAPGNPASL
jgi:RNA polymerase sigma-70 factor (ECF subfamily)